MGITKTAGFSESQNKNALLFKALGHPARIAIIDHLIAVKTCICNDLVGVLPLSQATISQHLRELKEAGIIQGTIEGNAICYCLNSELMLEIKQVIDTYAHLNQANQTPCC
jgi:DNA-binding transcriptional ArsR family regulator